MRCENQAHGHDWSLYLGDCCEVIKGFPDGCMDFSIHSPPFANLYIYSDSERDMGNCATDVEFFRHYSFLIPELYRVTRPGRLAAVHCKDLVDYANRDGRAGLRDFPGEIVRSFEAAGFKYHSRVTIWKDPVTEMQRTKAQGLLHAQIKRDSSLSRQGLPDYLLLFRRWPDLGQESVVKPVARPDGFVEYVGKEVPEAERMVGDDLYSIQVWQRYASPVWFDIDQMDVLNKKKARGEGDERHICPLQLGVIRRAVDLWTMPGDVVFTPFAGIGSELYGAMERGRKAIGIELKPEYFDSAVKNLKALETEKGRGSLLDLCGFPAPYSGHPESVYVGD